MFHISGKAQDYYLVNFDVGPEFHMLETNPSTLFLGGKVRLRGKGFEIYSGVSLPISSFGTSDISITDENEVIPYKSLYNYKPVLGFGFNIIPAFKYTSPFFGVGYSIFPSYKINSGTGFDAFNQINPPNGEFYISAGFRTNRFASYLNIYLDDIYEGLTPIVALGFQYEISLTNTGRYQDGYYELDFKRNLNEVVARLDFGAGGRLGISRGENVMVFGATVGLMAKVKGNHFMGVQFEYGTYSLAFSNNFIKNRAAQYYVHGKYGVEGNNIQNFNSYSLHYLRKKTISEKTDFYYGAGISYFHKDHYRTGTTRSAGPMLIAKLRNGIFHSSIQTQFPVSNFPFYLGLHFGTGFNLKSWKEMD